MEQPRYCMAVTQESGEVSSPETLAFTIVVARHIYLG